ncbi:hypothetical protein DV736_g918, partial [Chaetothyriales sp. CBS 134916]
MASAIQLGDNNSGFQVGVANAPVSVKIDQHTAPEQLETPPSPSALIPFSRDPHFIERGTILDQLDQKFTTPGSRTALVGLGGIGKSQLAIEYVFRDIADCARISGRQSHQAPIFKLVRDWLSDQRRRRWVLILDNVDDAHFLVESWSSVQKGTIRDSDGGSRPLKEYIPQSANGYVLITSRSRSAALELTEEDNIIPVEPMDKSHATALLQKKLENVENQRGIRYPDNDIAELVTALEFMPLAIVQAAAYISKRAPRHTVRQYLEQFQQSDCMPISLLDREGGQLRRDREAKNSIITTWQISFDRIRETRPSAADLLSLMSFFDRQGIPEALLRSPGSEGGGVSNQNEDSNGEWDVDKEDSLQCNQNEEFEEDILELRDFSFISVDREGTTFEMHRLVQLATRKWLAAHDQLERWKQQFITNLYTELPTGEYEHWATWRRLFPHTQSAAAQRPQAEESLREWSMILYRAGWYALRMGNGVDAQKMSVEAMKARTTMLGPEHEDTLDSIAMVGLAYNLRGLWGLAEELEVQVMETRKAKLGADHPDTLTSMANLASTYRNQGRWEAAEELDVQVMETRKAKLGADHPSTLTSMANLASTYRNQGRWEAAEELDVQVMETRKAKLGADYPSTLTSMANLASTYRNQGRWEAAEELEVQVMETSKAKLGADHPSTLTSMNNLASKVPLGLVIPTVSLSPERWLDGKKSK